MQRSKAFKQFFRNWMLVIAMITGASAYMIYHSIPEIHFMGPALNSFVSVIQPVLLFIMLFLTFCKMEPKELKVQKWQIWLLLIQGGAYAGISYLLILHPDIPGRLAIEAAMICLICPTATACAVVTGKLGGNITSVISYTILINLLVAIIIPLMVPLTNPVEGLDFWSASAKILAKVFPLLIMPFLSAWALRYFAPKVHAAVMKKSYISFYIWAFSLTLAIAVGTKYIVSNNGSVLQLAGIAGASLLACAFQFLCGKAVGSRYGYKITAGQVMGQKNTVFAIWIGYTFYSPIVSVAGAFYSIWHNCYNTYQLHKAAQSTPSSSQ